MDVVHGDAVVEAGLLLVGEVAEAVPLLYVRLFFFSLPFFRSSKTGRRRTLAAALGVEGPDIIVDDAGTLADEFLVESLTAEERRFGIRVERPVERDSTRTLEIDQELDVVVCCLSYLTPVLISLAASTTTSSV